MYVVVSLEYLEKFILPIDEKSGRYSYTIYARPKLSNPSNKVPKTSTATTFASPQSNISKYPTGTLVLSTTIYKTI
jgi:hypothetical protein